MKRILIILFFFFSLISYADDFTVIIKGNFPGGEGQSVRLMQYTDQITYNYKEISDTIIGDEGDFHFKFRLYEPIYIYYRIDFTQVGHYVEPGNAYKINFEPIDFDTLDDRRNPYLDTRYFAFDLYNENNRPDELNEKISKFNDVFDVFLLNHFSGRRLGRLNQQFKEFREYTDSLFQIDSVENPFFLDFYEYKFATYYRVADLKRPLQLFEEYIIDKPIRYNNPQYMNFFNTVFDKFLVSESRDIEFNDLTTSINAHNSYYALMDSLGKDTVLRNELLRELVMLKGLKNMYNSPDVFSRNNVISIIKYVEKNSKFHQHKEIASNIIKSIKYLEKGYPAPELRIEDEGGSIISLEDFKGKFVLLNFFASWCVPCLGEFSVMNDLYEEHGEHFEFISISIDRNKEDYKRFIDDNQYPWKFYHFNNNFRLLDGYEIRKFPSFVLIDPESYIIESKAPFPSRGLHKVFNRALSEWDNKKSQK